MMVHGGVRDRVKIRFSHRSMLLSSSLNEGMTTMEVMNVQRESIRCADDSLIEQQCQV